MKEETWRIWDILAKILGGLGLIGTLGWTMWSFTATRQQEIEAFNRTKQKEIDFAVWNRKFDTYTNLLHFAGITSLKDPPLIKVPERNEFWQIYLGAFNAVSVDDPKVREAAKVFADTLNECEQRQGSSVMNLQDYQLQAKVDAIAKAVGDALKR